MIELALTILVWNRGWRWKALLPMALSMTFAFGVTVLAEASGSCGDEVLPVVLLGSAGSIIALIVMAFNPPRRVR